MKRFLFRHTWPWGFVYLACVPLVSGQSSPKVLSIRVTTVGTVEVGEALIRANMRVKEGEPFSTSAITADIQHLYETGYFRNIQVSEERTPDGINLTYLLEAKPRITEITFQGNKRYKNRKLAAKVTSKVGQTLDDRKLFADAQAIKEMYVKAGYPGTKVTPKITNIDEARGRGSVMFEVTESPKVKITGVEFPGRAAFSNKEVRKTIKTRKRWWLSWVTGSGILKEDQIEEDREKLATFYQNKGYIDFEIKDVRYTYEGTTKVHVVFDLTEGKEYRLGQIRVEGTQLFSPDQLIAEMKMKAGDVFTPKGLRANLKSVQDAYGRKGYIDARVSASEDANTQSGNMDLTVTVDEGE